MKSALSSKAASEEITVLDALKLDGIKTKEMAKVFGALNTGKKVLLVLDEKNDTVYKSARNIEGANILNCDTMVILKDAVTKLEEVYA